MVYGGILGWMMAITCSQLTYCSKFLAFRRIQPDSGLLDRLNYSNHDLIKVASKMRRGTHCGRGPGLESSSSMP
ncbi:hypothetical protein TNCV_4442571 [Trichonephila clavipes]|nr:hypothetical protein TNCV_4442571 [Trichonephila clavipes]